MTATAAQLGYGTILQIRTSTGPDVWLKIGEQMKIKPPSFKVDTVDATHTESPDAFREYIAGLADGESMSFDINYVPGDSSVATLLTYLRTAVTARVVFANGYIWNFVGIQTSFAPDAPEDGKMTAAIEFKVTGKPTLVAPSAPVNSVLPAISGTLATGDTLTAYEGNWSGAPTFTYQWKNATVNINGATSKTYVLAAGDSGDSITVTVTATNAAGSASATSAPVIGA
ncbi:phage tail tube protein [Pseudolabrys sp. Root1462]|uniref:phage tail tube protein n=1 Tax=Pseudolabrys sp. Root1462 TaxID=1736466 RepID=UPI000AA38140|nr:phage tail tube protein [Pseudolabrys sp. Root1462]